MTDEQPEPPVTPDDAELTVVEHVEILEPGDTHSAPTPPAPDLPPTPTPPVPETGVMDVAWQVLDALTTPAAPPGTTTST